MGLLDVLNGMQQGPRGSGNPNAQGSGGMSPMTMAILGLLAWKAVKHFSGTQPNTTPAPSTTSAGGGMGGGIGDLLKGGLGGLLAGGAAGSVLSGGGGGLVKAIPPKSPGGAAQFLGGQRAQQKEKPPQLRPAP